MIAAGVRMHAVAERLLRAVDARVGSGARPLEAAASGSEPVRAPLWIAPEDPERDRDRVRDDLAAFRLAAPAGRVVVLGPLGTHRDSPSPRLRAWWEIEEMARGVGLPTLTLRLAPMVGPSSPLWLRLRSGERPPRADKIVLQPVAEHDVVETLARVRAGTAPDHGWFEVAGPEAWTLAELGDLARRSGAPTPPGSGAWEPALDEMRAIRLAEAEPWTSAFAIAPRPLASLAAEWAS